MSSAKRSGDHGDGPSLKKSRWGAQIAPPSGLEPDTARENAKKHAHGQIPLTTPANNSAAAAAMAAFSSLQQQSKLKDSLAKLRESQIGGDGGHGGHMGT